MRQLGVLKEYGANKKPKNLIWLYFEGNDLDELDEELNNKVLIKYLEKNFTQSLMDHQEEININKTEKFNSIISKRDDLIYKIRFVRLYELRKLVKRYLDNYTYRKNMESNNNYYFSFNSNVFSYFKEIISEAKDLTESWGGNFLFVYIPEFARYNIKINDTGAFRNKEKVIEFLKNKNISTLDLDKKLFKNEKNYNLSYMGPIDHLTPFGYKKIAELIVNQAVKD